MKEEMDRRLAEQQLEMERRMEERQREMNVEMENRLKQMMEESRRNQQIDENMTSPASRIPSSRGSAPNHVSPPNPPLDPRKMDFILKRRKK